MILSHVKAKDVVIDQSDSDVSTTYFDTISHNFNKTARTHQLILEYQVHWQFRDIKNIVENKSNTLIIHVDSKLNFIFINKDKKIDHFYNKTAIIRRCE